jgi:hypothetical protein
MMFLLQFCIGLPLILFNLSMYIFVRLGSEKMGPLNSAPSTMYVSSLPVPELATRSLPSYFSTPNSGLTQYDCGRMKP